MDRTAALADGSVAPRRCRLRFLPFPAVGDLFRRMAQDAEFDAAEMSLSTFMLLLGRGDDRLVGIPAFPSRAFRHGQIYVHSDSGVSQPADLAGCAVGVPEYQMTAALWIRAILQHDHGLSPTDVTWWTGGSVTPVYRERLAHDPPPGVTLRRIPRHRALEEMLLAGDLDALVTVRPPVGFDAGGEGPVRRLFPDYREVERSYYERTGYFPIMHTVVMRRDLYEADPLLAVDLLDTFQRAREAGRREVRDTTALAVAHPWLADELRQMDALFSGDPFSHDAVLPGAGTVPSEAGRCRAVCAGDAGLDAGLVGAGSSSVAPAIITHLKSII
jgi:4,5-dihydroxyphthalate decarboxylase